MIVFIALYEHRRLFLINLFPFKTISFTDQVLRTTTWPNLLYATVNFDRAFPIMIQFTTKASFPIF